MTTYHLHPTNNRPSTSMIRKWERTFSPSPVFWWGDQLLKRAGLYLRLQLHRRCSQDGEKQRRRRRRKKKKPIEPAQSLSNSSESATTSPSQSSPLVCWILTSSGGDQFKVKFRRPYPFKDGSRANQVQNDFSQLRFDINKILEEDEPVSICNVYLVGALAMNERTRSHPLKYS